MKSKTDSWRKWQNHDWWQAQNWRILSSQPSATTEALTIHEGLHGTYQGLPREATIIRVGRGLLLKKTVWSTWRRIGESPVSTLFLPTRVIHMKIYRHDDWGIRRFDLKEINWLYNHLLPFPAIKRSNAYLPYRRGTVKKRKTTEHSTVNVKDYKRLRRSRHHQAWQYYVASSASIDGQWIEEGWRRRREKDE